jgi:hypothetical protein
MKNIFYIALLMAHTMLWAANDGGVLIGTPPLPKGPIHEESILPDDFFSNCEGIATTAVVSAAAAAAALENATISTLASSSSQSASAGATTSSNATSSSSSTMQETNNKTPKKDDQKSGNIGTDDKKKGTGTTLSAVLAQRKLTTAGKTPQASLSLSPARRRASLTSHTARISTRTGASSTHHNGTPKRSGTLPNALPNNLKRRLSTVNTPRGKK